METNTPVPEVAQRKSIAQRIEETKALERQFRAQMVEAEKEMEPWKVKYEALRGQWCAHYNRLNQLKEIAAEEEKEIAQ